MKTAARNPGPASPARQKLDGPSVAPSPPNIAPALALRTASHVVPAEVAWLWPGNLALGKVTVLAGTAGGGKTLLAAGDFAARVSLGADWPDGSPCPRGDVVIASGEDSAADTLVPRLVDHGADLSRVHFVEGMSGEVEGFAGEVGGTAGEVGGEAGGGGGTPEAPAERAFTLADLPALEREMLRRDSVRLVVLDPVSAFLGDGGQGPRVRALLAPLRAMAARRAAAVLLVTHLRKAAAAGAAQAVLGSVALVAAARSAWLLTRDADDPDRRLLSPIKNNLGQDRFGYAWKLVERKVAWEKGRLELRGDDALAAAGMSRQPGPREAQAAAFVADFLKAGPRAWNVVVREGKKAGHSAMTLERARHAAAETYKLGGRKGRWLWRLHGDRRVEPVENPMEQLEREMGELFD